MTQTTQTIEIIATIAAFAGEPRRRNRIQVELDTGTVRAWDSVAGHYTVCHAINEQQQARLIKRAARQD